MSELQFHVVGERKASYRCPNCARAMSYTGTFLPPLRATCRGCATTVHFDQNDELIPLDEHVGETITLTVSFGDERLSEFRELAQHKFGLDLVRNLDWLLDLAAIALTLQVWRNSPLEDIHAGVYGTHDLPDEEMMRLNIDTFRLIRAHLAQNRVVSDELIARLTDPARTLPTGRTLSDTAGPGLDDLLSHMRSTLHDLREYERKSGAPYVLHHLAVNGAFHNSHWYGTPWWPDVVDTFIEALDIPDSFAYRYDEHPETQPGGIANREHLRSRLKTHPEKLDDECIGWCLRHGLGFTPVRLGLTRWQLRVGHTPDDHALSELHAHDAARLRADTDPQV